MSNFSLDDYVKIEKYCTRYLFKNLHARHLEDLIQFVAMRYFEKGGQANFEWLCLDYLRQNGLLKNGSKVGARTIENATFVGHESDENDNESEMAFLYNSKSIEVFEEENQEQVTTESILEDFLRPLNLKKEVLRWAVRNYQVSSLRIK